MAGLGAARSRQIPSDEILEIDQASCPQRAHTSAQHGRMTWSSDDQGTAGILRSTRVFGWNCRCSVSSGNRADPT
jgi:hypothetical protein